MKTLSERAEEARLSGNRELCLKLKAQEEAEEQKALQDRHKKEVETVKRDFPIGTYIKSIGTIEAITDGCGTQRGWISIKMMGSDRTYTPQELRQKINKAQKHIRIAEYFGKLKCPASGRVYIGDYEEAFGKLIAYMEMDRIWTMEEWDDNNVDSFWEIGDYARKKAIDEGYTDEEAETRGQDAEDEARNEAYTEYKDKVIESINCLLHYADLELEEGKNGKYYIKPLKNWIESANKMAEVITGYGTFEYRSGKELKEVGPYKTYSKAVIEHLHWLKHGPEIYGGRGYDYMMR